MSDLRIAHRYAEALISAAGELHLTQQINEDFILIQHFVKESREFQLFLKSPIIKKEKKEEVLETIFGKAIQPLTLQFLCLLTEKGREEVLQKIIDAFFQLRDVILGVVGVDVKVAVKLSDEQTSRLQKYFEEYTSKKIRFEFNVDKQLIGGFIARLGDTVFDGSVKRQLELLHHLLTKEISIQ